MKRCDTSHPTPTSDSTLVSGSPQVCSLLPTSTPLPPPPRLHLVKVHPNPPFYFPNLHFPTLLLSLVPTPGPKTTLVNTPTTVTNDSPLLIPFSLCFGTNGSRRGESFNVQSTNVRGSTSHPQITTTTWNVPRFLYTGLKPPS